MGFLGNLFGGDDSASKSIEKAGQLYQQYAQKGIDEIQKSRVQGRKDITSYTDPYVKAGKEGLDAYMGSLGLGADGGAGQQRSVDRFRESPGYQFALQEGLGSIRSGQAARGLTGSGAELRELQRYGQGIASQEYGNYQQRLAGLASMGQQTSVRTGFGLADMGKGYAEDLSGIYSAQGQEAASAEIAEGRAKAQERSAPWSTLGTLAGTAIGAFYGGTAGAKIGAKAGSALGGGGSPGLSSLSGNSGNKYS